MAKKAISKVPILKIANSRMGIVVFSGFITCSLAAFKLGNIGLAKTTIALAAMNTLAGLVAQLYKESQQANERRLFLILLFIVVLSILAIASWTALFATTATAGGAVWAWLLARGKERNRRHNCIPNFVALAGCPRLLTI